MGKPPECGADSITAWPQPQADGAISAAGADSQQVGSGAGAQLVGSGSQQTGAGSQQGSGSQQVGADSPPRMRLSSQPAEAGLIPTKVARVTARVHRRAWRIDRFIFISGGGCRGQNRSDFRVCRAILIMEVPPNKHQSGRLRRAFGKKVNLGDLQESQRFHGFVS